MAQQVWYEVRLKFYQYNSGRGDNGFSTHSRKFGSLSSAKNYINDIKKLLLTKDSCERNKEYEAFVDEFIGYSGFLESILGIWKVTHEEEKLQ